MPKQKPGASVQEVGTPDVFIEAVCRRLHIKQFGWDLAAAQDNVIIGCGSGRGGEGRYFDVEDNALVQQWPTHGWNWLNPPFGDIGPWAGRCCSQSDRGCSTALLVPLSTGRWWSEFVDGQAYVLLLAGRLTFKGHTQAYPKDLALCLYVPWQAAGYELWDWRERPSDGR